MQSIPIVSLSESEVIMKLDLDSKRGTGRTTKMLFAAAQVVAQGHSVEIVVHSDTFKREVERLIRYYFSESLIPNFKVLVYDNIDVVKPMFFNHHNRFIDHHVLYGQLKQFERIYEEFTKYD